MPPHATTPSGPFTTASRKAAYGTDASADAMPLVALAAMRVDASDPDSISAFRRAALNTVDHLETAVERLVEERNALAAKLSYRLDMPAVGKGVALLLAEMRRAVGEEDEPARKWLASTFTAVLVGPPEVARGVVDGIESRIEQMCSARPATKAATVPADTWATPIAAASTRTSHTGDLP